MNTGFIRKLTLTLLVLTLVAAFACGRQSTPTSTPTSIPMPTATPSLFPITITDSNGEEVTFDKPPERIIAFDSAAVEILFAIGEGHRIAGTHSFVSYPPESESIPRVGDAFNMDFEKIVELEPDLVYISFDRFQPDLERLGLNVLYIKSLNENLNDITDHIRLWGRITSAIDVAEKEATKFEARLSSIQDKLAGVSQGPRVYHHIQEFWTPGGDTLNGKIYTFLKAENIAQDISGWAQISPEVIVERDPETVITIDQAIDEFKNVTAFRNVSAMKNEKVFTIDADLLSVASPRLIDGIEAIARLLYPNLFDGSSYLPDRNNAFSLAVLQPVKGSSR